jgi:hypothetical protein
MSIGKGKGSMRALVSPKRFIWLQVDAPRSALTRAVRRAFQGLFLAPSYRRCPQCPETFCPPPTSNHRTFSARPFWACLKQLSFIEISRFTWTAAEAANLSCCFGFYITLEQLSCTNALLSLFRSHRKNEVIEFRRAPELRSFSPDTVPTARQKRSRS